MQSEGIVTKISGNFATVRTKRASACGHDCGECRLCKNPEAEVVAVNKAKAQVGDRVIIDSPSSEILLLAFLLYIMPIAGSFIVGGLLYAANAPSYVIAGSVFLYVVLWFLAVRRIKVKKSRVLEVIQSEKN